MTGQVAKTLEFARKTGHSLGRIGRLAGHSLLDLVLPPACCLCHEPIESGDFCPTCRSTLTLSEPEMDLACPRCGIPRPPAPSLPEDPPQPPPQPTDPDGRAVGCPHCQAKRFRFDRVIALWHYRDAVCDAVVAAKYAHRVALADALGRRLGQHVADRLDGVFPELITFVPSHLTRQLSRGGNGNEAIARAVARQLRRPHRPLLRISRRIAKQAWLDDSQRRRNVRGAFSTKKSIAFLGNSRLDGRHVLLVDDVLTTGATADEAADALRQGGAARVTLAVVARALRD